MKTLAEIMALLKRNGWILQECSYFGGYATVRLHRPRTRQEFVWVKKDEWLEPIIRCSR